MTNLIYNTTSFIHTLSIPGVSDSLKYSSGTPIAKTLFQIVDLPTKSALLNLIYFGYKYEEVFTEAGYPYSSLWILRSLRMKQA